MKQHRHNWYPHESKDFREPGESGERRDFNTRRDARETGSRDEERRDLKMLLEEDWFS